MQALTLKRSTLTDLDPIRRSRLVRSGAREPTRGLTGSLRREDGANGMTTFDNADLVGWIEQLQGNERDLRSRLAARVAALGHPAAPISDPIYQRLFFALAGLEVQRAEAESVLARRVALLVK
jgi:hypothetical protein